MNDSFIDYGQLIDDAMHVIVRQALQRVARAGLPGSHHFYISFMTKHPGVELSERLRKRYPKEMTIVLQYQFEDLRVAESEFSVVLSFDNIKEKIAVPFAALSAFADPSVKFGLQFRHLEEEESGDSLSDFDAAIEEANDALDKKSNTKNKDSQKATESEVAQPKKSATGEKRSKEKDTNVVSLDHFRKKD